MFARVEGGVGKITMALLKHSWLSIVCGYTTFYKDLLEC